MRSIDGKFSTDGTKIFDTVSGEEIPEVEPLFLLRGRDILAWSVLNEYRDLAERNGCNELHLARIDQAIWKFGIFKGEHPELMKEPGVTRHLKLEE